MCHKGDSERFISHNRESQPHPLLQEVQRPAVGTRYGLRSDEDLFEQAVEILLLRQRSANVVELLKTSKEVLNRFQSRSLSQIAPRQVRRHAASRLRYLMQTARTWAMSVIP